MALELADRVRETTTVTGTGPATLLGAVTGFQSFAVIGDTNTCYYTISDQSGPNFEVGIGTYSTAGPTLTRTTVLSSSNSNVAVSFPAGIKDIFVTYPAEKSVNLDAAGNVSALGTVASATWQATAITTTYGGTGLTSYTAGDLSYYATGTTFTKLAIGSSKTILTSTGTAPQWSASLDTSQGGTGLTSYTAGDLSYYASGTTFTTLGIGTAGQILTSTGTAPQWSTLSGVAVTTFSAGTTGFTPNTATSGAITLAGTLAVTNGGTGLTSLTTGRIPFGANTAAFGNSANLFFDSANTRLGVGTATPAVTAAFVGTDSILVPKGTTAEQPTGVTGYLRYNTTTEEFEGFSGSPGAWKSVGGSAISNDTSTATDLFPLFAAATTGTAQNVFTSDAKYLYKPSTGELKASAVVATNGLVINSATASANYTVATGQNAMSVGPFTVNSGVVVTVSSGSRWVIL